MFKMNFFDFRNEIKMFVDSGIDRLQLKLEAIDTTVLAEKLGEYVYKNIKIPVLLTPFKFLLKNLIYSLIAERLEELKSRLLEV